MGWSCGGKRFERWTNLVGRSESRTGGNFDHEHSFRMEEKDHISLQITQAEVVRKQNLISIPTISKSLRQTTTRYYLGRCFHLQYPLHMPESISRLMKLIQMQMRNLIIQGARPLLPCPALAPFCCYILL